MNWRQRFSVLFFAGLAATYFVYKLVPSAFVPNEDQGYIMLIIQAPSGASLDYTSKIEEQVQQFLTSVPEVRGVFAVSGFSFTGTAPNRGIVFATLKPYSERKGEQHGAAAVVDRIRGPLFAINGAIVLPFLPPAVQ